MVLLISSMMVYIDLTFFSAPSRGWGMAFKSRSQTFHTNVIFAFIMKTDWFHWYMMIVIGLKFYFAQSLHLCLIFEVKVKGFTWCVIKFFQCYIAYTCHLQSQSYTFVLFKMWPRVYVHQWALYLFKMLSTFCKMVCIYVILMSILVCGNYVNYYDWFSFILTRFRSSAKVLKLWTWRMHGNSPQHAYILSKKT